MGVKHSIIVNISMSHSNVNLQQINALLPQTQCKRCGYEGCEPYAKALMNHEADINRCPPGGKATIQKFATLLNQAIKPLDPQCGDEKTPHVAMIIEEDCIGCTKCLIVCPVDAIVGAAKMMHTVIANECTGCELCLPPCPVDCIVMKTTTTKYLVPLAKQRYQAKQQRVQALEEKQKQRIKNKRAELITMIK
jgi:electron transport complex protein RnfB